MALLSRRYFLKSSLAAGPALAMPFISSRPAFGAEAPSNTITVACIGTGRMGMVDLKHLIDNRDVRIVAVCDVDSQRAANAKSVVDSKYLDNACKVYSDFREVLARPDIDAALIVTPDHWHGLAAVEAAKRGKDIYIEKPLTLTVREGRVLADTVRDYGRILQVGSQQRSDHNFRIACELVRNGRIGKLSSVLIGISADVGGGDASVMPVPSNLDYDMWLGPAPWAPYTEDRVHPQTGFTRPGWLRLRDHCCGMITGWGSHHIDIAHWAMGVEDSGPIEVSASAEFPADGLWNVHTGFSVDYVYANGVKMNCSDDSRNRNGITFIGTEGSIFVTRGSISSEPSSLLNSQIGLNGIRLIRSNDHVRNWLDSIRSRRDPIASVEVGHRSCTACILGDIAMVTGQKLKWDPAAERFLNSDLANGMLSRPMRGCWAL